MRLRHYRSVLNKARNSYHPANWHPWKTGIRPRWLSVFGAVAFAWTPASGWELPPDNGVLGQEAINAILSGNDYPETTTYQQTIELIDFSANGRNFTQVAIILTPDKPLIRNGRKIVIAGAEPGSEYGMDFITTVEGKEGPGVWLAKRGVTFIALTRVGRWNFLAPTNDGSWESVPIGQRMPLFDRRQTAHWPESEYEVRSSGQRGTDSASVSGSYRFPRKGSELEKQMLAATPRVFIEGYRLALEKAIPERESSLVLFWGMSTGGASLYPLAKYWRPDGYLGWGTSSTGLAYANNRALSGEFGDLYAPMALRVRERGFDDFVFYTRHVDPETRMKWWQVAQKSPRFKSVEDAAMQFAAGALAEQGLRLWQSDLLSAEQRARGFSALMQEMFETSHPPAELKDVPVLELNGTADEVLPPATVDANRKIMEPYVKTYRVGRIEGLRHYLFTQDSIKIVGSVWMRYIDSGYFD